MRKEIPTILINAFKEGKVILFIGSGLSISGKSGYFSSSQFSEFLLSQTITESGNGIELGKFIIDKTNLQLDDIAEYFEIFTSKQDLLEIIKKKFNNPTIPAFPVHKEIWELPNIKHIYTTNFDPLIEKGLSASKIRAQPMVITNVSHLI